MHASTGSEGSTRPIAPIGTKREQWAACRRWVPWRHLFKTIARRAGTEASIRCAICRHAPGATAESYERVAVEDMAEAIARFPRYPL